MPDLDVVAKGLAAQLIEDDTVQDVVMEAVVERHGIDIEDDEFVDKEDEIAHELFVKVATQLVLAANGFALKG